MYNIGILLLLLCFGQSKVNDTMYFFKRKVENHFEIINYPASLQLNVLFSHFKESVVYKNCVYYFKNVQVPTQLQSKVNNGQSSHILKSQAALYEQFHPNYLWEHNSLEALLVFVGIASLIVISQRIAIRRIRKLAHRNEEYYRSQQAQLLHQLEEARIQAFTLMQELENANKKLTCSSLNFIQKNELLEQVRAGIHSLKNGQGQTNIKELKGLTRLVDNNLQIDKYWQDFKISFEGMHKDFYHSLLTQYPQLTNHELKLCSLLKLNMTLKQTANIMGISPESVKKARYRLRKKFNLSRHEDLNTHIIRLEKQSICVDVLEQVA